MRAGPAIAGAMAAALRASASAQATARSDFAVGPVGDCFVGTCVATLGYDTSGLQAPVTVEIDWDTSYSPGGFAPDQSIACQAPLPADPYAAPPCTARS